MSPLSLFKLFRFLHPSRRRALQRQAGFTLIEMVTVAAIFTIMTAVVLANLPAFRQRTSLELVAEEVALVIRQAQAFGSITRATPVVVGGDSFIFPSYGVYLNLSDDGAPMGAEPSDSRMIFFADQPPDAHGYVENRYDPKGGCGSGNPESECREVYNLQGGIKLTQLYFCTGDNTCGKVSAADIVFQRPNPEAIFVDGKTGQTCASCSHAKIMVMSSDNLCAEVVIWSTGHIYSDLLPPSSTCS